MTVVHGLSRRCLTGPLSLPHWHQHHPTIQLSSLSRRRLTARPTASTIDDAISSSKTDRQVRTKLFSSLKNAECMDYCRGWAWQTVLLNQRLDARRRTKRQSGRVDDDDIILLLEHAPVYTLGRGASEDHLTFLESDNSTTSCNEAINDAETIRKRLSRKYRGPDAARLSVDRRFLQDELLHLEMDQAVDLLASSATPVLGPNGVPIWRVDRGGEVTFHGPSQLVVYPLVDLKRQPYQADLHWFLRMVEEVVIQILSHYGIEGNRDDINTGVWVGGNKIAAVGVSASSWISSHGFALNVFPDLDFFNSSIILPCGIEGRGVTSIADVLMEREETCPSMEHVSQIAIHCLQDVFQMEIESDSIKHII